MKTKAEGKRDKVHTFEVESAVRTLNAPPAIPQPSAPIKPVSNKQRESIRRSEKWPSLITVE